ncbi:hypothetical protein K504DRAFT_475139 [Pleomassaria siparia CBS 279.74]|uniref:ELYS-like domain-containing protein n=1 Tax=Pleomassaria siparia CBS 279.74 TaxID=1314801 RepID=A0A6G1JPX6_9PLEO|nr:hypothetical protein K504DRAFT_475139 [Pleomassaria siparia CBS 279.74]
MLDIEEYEAVFQDDSDPSNEGKLLEYTEGISYEIHNSQHLLGGKTFFERLLELLKIKWRKIYPPKGDKQLRELHKRIVESASPLHYKHCLFFYILKDLSPSYHGRTELAAGFARAVHLEKRFWTFIEGLWNLDHLMFDTAVASLTHPSIIQQFPDEIILTLLNRQHYGAEVAENDVLPLAYYNCAKPPLLKEDAKVEFVKYMADRNITETFYWIRARPNFEHKQLLEILVTSMLGRTSSYEKDLYSREERAIEFVSLPFDEDEEKFVEHFLTEGKGRSYSGAADTVLMRRIATGRLQEVANDTTIKGRKHAQVNWEVLKDGVTRGLGPRNNGDSPFVV